MNTQLERAVIDQLGLSYTDVNELRGTLQDIRDHGIDGGFGGHEEEEDDYHEDHPIYDEDDQVMITAPKSSIKGACGCGWCG